MKRRDEPMDKMTIRMMCDNINKLKIDIDEMAYNNPEKCVRFIHGQYEEAKVKLNQSAESQF